MSTCPAPLGTLVVLSGLSAEAYNGQQATIVAAKSERGRYGLMLEKTGERFSVLAEKMTHVGEAGTLGAAARILGVDLKALGLQPKPDKDAKEKTEGEEDDGFETAEDDEEFHDTAEEADQSGDGV